MSIENSTSIISAIDFESYVTDIFIILGSAATAILAFFIFRQTRNLLQQTKEMKRTNLLAHSPFLVPRFRARRGMDTLLVIANVGPGSAIHIQLRLFDDNTNDELDPFNRFALAYDESRITDISFTQHPQIRIEGTYQDISGVEHTIHTVADFNEMR